MTSVMRADDDFSISAGYLDFIPDDERTHRLGRA